MPRGPNGQKRKADVIGNAVLVMKIATGQVEEAKSAPKSAAPLAPEFGGRARAKKLSPKNGPPSPKRRPLRTQPSVCPPLWPVALNSDFGISAIL